MADPAQDRTSQPAVTRRRNRRTAGNPGILEDLLGYHLRRAQVATFQHFTVSVKPFDVTPGQFGVLALIAANPGMSQSQLAMTLNLDRSTVVTVIDRLQRHGFIERRPAPGDRRTNALYLTNSGEEAYRRLEQKVERHERDVSSALTADERRQLVNLLRRLGP